jgi:ATP-binding protein involved in chromosome partitioning
MAAALDADFLGEVPLDTVVREHSDSGAPVVSVEPASAQAAVFKEIAFRVAGMVSMAAFAKGRAGPGASPG